MWSITLSLCCQHCSAISGGCGCGRGRLSVIHGLLGAPPGSLFAQMENSQNKHHVGDVKYHLGRSATLEFEQARRSACPCLTWHCMQAVVSV